MDASILERSIGLVFAIVVGGTTTVQMIRDWNVPGLDNQVTKLLLGLMAFGCILVALASVGLIGHA